MSGASWMTSLTNQINAFQPSINAQAVLQSLVNTAIADIQSEFDTIADSASRLSSLVKIPTDISGVIGWIAGDIGHKVAQYNALISQAAALASAVTRLLDAIEDVTERLDLSGFSVPSITIPTIPDVSTFQ